MLKNLKLIDSKFNIVNKVGMLTFCRNDIRNALTGSCIINDIINTIIEIDLNLDIAEQYNPITKEQMSAKKLTWNYAELYSTLKLML